MKRKRRADSRTESWRPQHCRNEKTGFWKALFKILDTGVHCNAPRKREKRMKASLSIERTNKLASSNRSDAIARRGKLKEILRQHFGYVDFRGRQLEAIEAVLSGQDCFCLMPTGGGKSLCYQIPALAKQGIVLVVSPLIALMENQVAALKSLHIRAEFLSSTQGASIKSRIFEDLDSGKPSLRLLYVTPELIATAAFSSKLKKLYERGLLSLIAIDEAHCISSWGHDFRPSYRQLSTLRRSLPSVPILALTATAAKKVQEDIVKSLSLHRPTILISSFNRPNIYYEVRYKDLLKNTYDDLRDLLRSDPGSCAIVYCHARNTCDEIGAKLQADGISSRVYHAGLADKVRSQALDEWSSGKVPIIVGTVAFGMGIDRKDVRLVCHFNIPKSIEGFYQESGRAGRDNKDAKSVLYYGLEDGRSMEFILRNPRKERKKKPGAGDAAIQKGLQDFKEMVSYCDQPGCRRQKLLGHFGEKVSATLCAETCDSCHLPTRVPDKLQQLSEAASMRCSYRPNVFVSSRDNGAHDFQSEFWNYSDNEDANDSEDDISGSEDEAAQIADAAMKKHKHSSKSKLEAKLDSLLQAEKEYSMKKGNSLEESSGTKKNMVDQALRGVAMQKLSKAIDQAAQRHKTSSCHMRSLAEVLEKECFTKYGKSGRSFYNSQVASILRWLSSCSLANLEARVPKETTSNAVQRSAGTLPSRAVQPALEKKRAMQEASTPEKPKELNGPSIAKDTGPRDLFSSSNSGAMQELPAIPSFSTFMSKKLKPS